VTVRDVLLIASVAVLAGCASVPSAPPATVAASPLPPSVDKKVAWILRLEQQRVLRDALLPVPAKIAAQSGVAPDVEFRAAMTPDLSDLVRDPDSAIRARAALAIGRVGLVDGVPSLESVLGDPSDVVRGNAAFALGLLGSRASVPALLPLLADVSVVVRGRAIEALGLIGERSAAAAIVRAGTDCPAWLASVAADDEAWPKGPEIEMCRLSLYALVRLQDFDALAQIAIDSAGRPVSSWWPVAYALQRSGDRRALPALRALASANGSTTVGFALRGLTALEDPEALPLARALAVNRTADVKLRVAAVRLIARTGTAVDAKAIVPILSEEPPSSPLAIEVAGALGAMRAPEAFEIIVDLLSASAPAMRAAALGAAARIDPDAFLLVLSGLPRDPDWTVRASLATVLATLPAERVTPALADLSVDADARVHSAALRALALVKAPDLADRLNAALLVPDFAGRATAADLMGDLLPPGGATRLEAAYTRATSDSAYGARLAAVEAIAKYGDEAVPTLRAALSDAEWPIRLRAAALLRAMNVADAWPVRPAVLGHAPEYFESDALLHPAYSPRAFVETRRGVIEVQLELVDAPLTVARFIEQARAGLFNGLRVHRLVPGFVIQTGDPRGDGNGGPGYTQRDEWNPTPFLRGSVGMAHAGPETAGSQWFITTSPQPHLDARYTAFGRVVGGWDVLDLVAVDDVIERVRIWDGVELR